MYLLIDYLQQLLIPFDIFLISALTIKQAKAINIIRLSDNGEISRAAAKNSKIPMLVRIVVQMQVFLDSIVTFPFLPTDILRIRLKGSKETISQILAVNCNNFNKA